MPVGMFPTGRYLLANVKRRGMHAALGKAAGMHACTCGEGGVGPPGGGGGTTPTNWEQNLLILGRGKALAGGQPGP